jgi:hypothetical protein
MEKINIFFVNLLQGHSNSPDASQGREFLKSMFVLGNCGPFTASMFET